MAKAESSSGCRAVEKQVVAPPHASSHQRKRHLRIQAIRDRAAQQRAEVTGELLPVSRKLTWRARPVRVPASSGTRG
jgi:hypothetical protein